MKEKFKNRIDNIVKRITHLDAEIRHAIRLKCLHELSVTSEPLMQKFDDILACHGFNISRDAIIFELVMTLMRIWDRGKKTYSIPYCFDVVSDQNFIEIFVKSETEKCSEELLERSHIFRHREVLRTENRIRENIDEFLQLKPQVISDDIVVRLKEVRDNYYAHALKEITDTDEQTTVKFSEVYEILSETQKLVFLLNLGIIGTDIRYEQIEEDSDRIAKEYWLAVIGEGGQFQ